MIGPNQETLVSAVVVLVVLLLLLLLLYRDMIKMKHEKLCDVLGLNLIISPCSE